MGRVMVDIEMQRAMGRYRVQREQVGHVIDPATGGTTPRQDPGVLKRMFRRVTRLFRPVSDISPSDPEIPSDVVAPSMGLAIEPPRHQATRLLIDRQTAERNRIRAYRDFVDMDNQVPEVNRALNIVSDSATSNDRGDPTFRLVFGPTVPPNAKLMAEATVERLKLREQSAPMCRSMLKYGDMFAELVVDDAGIIVQLLPRNAATMIRVQDRHGNLKGFVQRIPGHTGTAIQFVPGEILHLRHIPEWGHRYGSSMMRAGRWLARHLQGMTDAVVANRLTRGVQRYGYLIPVDDRLSWQDRLEYVERIKEMNRREPLVDEDGTADLRTLSIADAQNVYMPVTKSGVGDLRVMEASRSVGTIEDARWLHRRFLVILPPPPSYLGIEEDVNSKATLSFEETNYIRFIKAKQQMEMSPGMTRIIRIQWALQGIILPPDAVEVRYAPASVLDEKLRAEIMKLQAETAEILGLNLGLPLKWIIRHVLSITNEAAKELEQALMQQAPPQPQGAEPEGEDFLRANQAVKQALSMHDDLGALVDGLRFVLKDLQDQKAPPTPYDGDPDDT